ncbi:hypothetical protein [Subtercola endophyticus]|uniref:hypothetical protein n=1 Tax=Subtercola endophyticus TaxID=2895559 RepID=UPI001E61BCF7|nr:hypothetical protein [Subtercola endophyticus]UFS58276.1 hypothetical protein LQ955_14830 [Subtercola endophyticus]
MTNDVAVQSPVRVAEWNGPEGIAARGTLVVPVGPVAPVAPVVPRAVATETVA